MKAVLSHHRTMEVDGSNQGDNNSIVDEVESPTAEAFEQSTLTIKTPIRGTVKGIHQKIIKNFHWSVQYFIFAE